MNTKTLKNNILLIFVILFLILYVILKDNFIIIFEQLKNVNLIWILLAVIVMIIAWLIKAIAFNLIIKEFKKDQKFVSSFKIVLITQFFNGVTPFSTGGQPMQMVFLKKEKITTANSTNIIIQNFIVYQIALILLGTIAIISNAINPIFFEDNLLRNLIVLGNVVNISVIAVLFLVSSSPKFNKTIGKFVISVSCRLRLIKDKSKANKKWREFIDNFTTGAKILRKQKSVFAKAIIYNFFSLLLIYSIPLIVLYSFNDFTSFGVGKTLITSAYIMLIGSFVPIPGGSVGLEFGFINLFGQFIVNPLLSAVMLLWRFSTYYLGLFAGGIALFLHNKEID